MLGLKIKKYVWIHIYIILINNINIYFKIKILKHFGLKIENLIFYILKI